jgi:hypothetical protein
MISASIKTMAGTSPSGSFLGISISFSTRSYWDGTTKSCLPRARGWCLHFELDSKNPVSEGAIRGEVSNLSTTGLTLTFSKKTGITAETFAKYFRNGKFFLDGEGSMAEEIARKLELSPTYTIPEGNYTYKEAGDTITIFFNRK